MLLSSGRETRTLSDRIPRLSRLDRLGHDRGWYVAWYQRLGLTLIYLNIRLEDHGIDHERNPLIVLLHKRFMFSIGVIKSMFRWFEVGVFLGMSDSE